MPRMTTTTIITTRQAAEQLGVSHSRVRQLCGQLGLGQVVGSTRLLTDRDLRSLQQTERRATRPDKSAT